MKIGQEQQILVEVGDYEFCIDLDEVLSIINPPNMVRLPSARGAFIRAFKYQDELGAAVSMRVKFALPERTDMKSGQILLGRLHGRLAGFWFDKVSQILKLGDGAEWFPIPADVRLPGGEFDSFIRYRDRLIPHTSLAGLLRFDQAEAWKQWVAEHKGRLEAGVLEAEAAEVAAQETEAAAKRHPLDNIPEEPALSLEDFYALMDEAGVVNDPQFEVAETPGEPLEPLLDTEQAAPQVEGLQMSELSFEADFKQAEEDEQGPPLAVPVGEPEIEVPGNGLQLTEEPEAPPQTEPSHTGEETAPSGDDALFSLERKRDDIRKRMNPEGDANLGDYSIIKVVDRGLLRWLRRGLRRLLLLALLAALAYTGYQAVQYQQQRKLALEQIWVRDAQGETDWPATREAVGREWAGFTDFVRKRLERLDPR